MASTAQPAGPSSNARWLEGRQHLLRGQLDAAHRALASMRIHEPDAALTHLLAAQIAWRENRIREGAAFAHEAARAGSTDPETLCTVVAVLLVTGEIVAARELLEHPALAACEDPLLLMRIAGHRKRLEEHTEALALLDRAQAQGHGSPALEFRRGEELMFNGRLAEAEAAFAESLTRAPAHGHVAVPLVRLRTQTPDHNHLELIARSLDAVKPGGTDHAALEFARYKTLEDLGRDQEAWEALAHGNALMYARLRDQAEQRSAGLDRFLEQCVPGIRRASARPVDGARPIFVVGMPRSGSTLLERMLGNHPEVRVTGELPDMGSQLHWVADSSNAHPDVLLARLPGVDFAEVGRRYLAQTQWRAQGKRFYVDKHSPNWSLAGVIHAALPQAPILNLVRDPMDVCFSNWRMFFGDASAWSYDQPTLARYCADYRRTMARWHALMPGAILDVHYADLVHEPEATLRKVLEFCGLEWQPGCADISRNPAPSSTLSTAQVRGRVHTRAFGEWRRYEPQLSVLARVLAQGPDPVGSP
jgi:tetratricopeptide (TPR) repeat protein